MAPTSPATAFFLAAAAASLASHCLLVAATGGADFLAGSLAAGALADVKLAKCAGAALPNTYCRVLQDPVGDYAFSGCCGASTQIVITPGLKDSMNLTVSMAPKSVEECKAACALDETCVVASPFKNEGRLFCNLWAASPCVYARMVCSGCHPDDPYISLGSWFFPCHGVAVDQTANCTEPTHR